jgi:type II secretion system protein D
MNANTLHRERVWAGVLALLMATGVALYGQPSPGGFGGFGGFSGLSGNRSRSTSGTTRTYPNSGEIGGAVISVDPETRSLIVVADDETLPYISQVISNLDRPKPQVLIKVVFMEVARNDASDIGVEGQFTKNVGYSWLSGLFTTNYTVASPGTTNATVVPSSITPVMSNTMVSGSHLFGPGLATSSTLPLSSAGIYSVLGQDYQVTLHAIAQAGKAKILSRPSIVARNNQPATILVGQTVPLITSVRYDSLGNAINGITYTDVGIILRVTPFITRDGMVEMILSPEISSVSKTDSTVISTGPLGQPTATAPFIDKRSADTVVVTPNGQTVIIGGLMRDEKAESETKVPLLGDLPLVGSLFKRKFKSDTKTELLIFLTPQIIGAPVEMAALTEKEENKSKATKAFTEKELNENLDRIPTKDPKTGKTVPPAKKPGSATGTP